ncbi:hypothetical protein JMN32_17720 [Fulvivirga sp. 29W222]|uniref:Outer membrane protein beta-barrel domain-containing protein n=1 Tax=Fulvivirga marina TaxID=2494733 RepID=A0A937G022_9BACT|nr:hypothetical protein [Fulvivirga marina]MBL6448162.1 hypothetical protein [Fulvivirga marina]
MRFLIIPILFCCSCASVYIPNSRNMPIIDHGGEVIASVKGGSTGFEGQLAFSPVDRFGIITDGLYKNSSTSETDDDYQKHEYLGIGAGYYEPISDWGVFELYGGYGKGEGSAQDEYIFFTSNTEYATGKYKRYFVQPGFALKKENIELGFCYRIARVEFYEFEDNNIQGIEISNTIMEPAVVFRAGGKNIKMDSQLGFNIPMYETEFEFPIFTISVGVMLRLDFGRKAVSKSSGDMKSPENFPQP